MSVPSNLAIDEDEFQRAKALIIGKARRYHLNPVEVSDRLIMKFLPEQVDRLVKEVAEAGFELTFKDHVGYIAYISARHHENRAPVFGAEPRNPGGRHAEAPFWANG